MKKLVMAVLCLGLLAATAMAEVKVSNYGAVKVHMLTVEGVQAYIFELSKSLIIADTGMSADFANSLLDVAKKIGKPIERVIISHAHPDHFKGSSVFKGMKVQTLPQVKKDIPNSYPVTGDLMEGRITIDGIIVEFIGLKGGEAPYSLLIGFPEQKVIYAAEYLFNKQHAYVYLGDFDNWIAGLKFLGASTYTTFLAADGTPPLVLASIDEDIVYLTDAKAAKAGSRSWNEYKQNMVAKYPSWSGADLIDFAAQSNPGLFK